MAVFNRGVFHVAKANLLKNWGSAVSLFMVILLTALLANTGIGLLLRMDSLYFEKLDEMNSLHNAFVLNRSLYQDSFADFFARDERIESYETETVIYMHPAMIDYGGEFESITLIQNLDTLRTISAPRILEPGSDELAAISKEIPPERAVYLPYYAKLNGYAIGDTYRIVYRNSSFDFIVAGFFETTESSLSMGLAVRVY
ncbi:MAG: hypothetical protein LBU99_06120, partial [Spirochaetaceae bacterium]|nr:hypothetical protein [Spirochaetaceae bacterium]